MELGWVDNYEQIKSVILAPGAGETGFTALGEILNGTVNPSGKTADTYVKNLLSTHYINNIGNFPYTNVDDLKAQMCIRDREVASRYLKELQEKDIDTLILGCTHYPLLRSTIGQIMGEGVTLVNPAYETALELGRLLKEQDMQSTGQGQSDFPYRFYVSDLAEKFKGFARCV